MRDALTVHRVLLEHGIAHEVARLPRPLHSADELPEVLDVPRAQCAVVRCYVVEAAGRGPASVHAVVVPAGTHPLPLALRTALHSAAVREATADEINRATDCAARLVTPVGLPHDVSVLVDAALDAPSTVWTPTGESGTAVALHGADLLPVTRGRRLDLTGGLPVERGGAGRAGHEVIDLVALEARAAQPGAGAGPPRRELPRPGGRDDLGPPPPSRGLGA